MSKIRYRVIVDGLLVGTRSSHRTYSHAIVIGNIPLPETTCGWPGARRVVGGMVTQAYCGSPELAARAARALQRSPTYYGFPMADLTVTIVPVACAHGIDYSSSAPPTNRSTP